jgi:uncharacterized SAM-binding protein YcdF (DUF218 family)
MNATPSTSPASNELTPPKPRSRLRRMLRAAERILAIAALLAIVWFVLPFQEWIYRGMDRQTPLEHARYIICLGGGMSRIVESAKLMQEGWADTLIVSNHSGYAAAMRDDAVKWGVPAEKILVDETSVRTRDHPAGVLKLGVDPQRDRCIIVTSYTHMPRSLACFQKAGFRHLILREPRWEREQRNIPNWRYGWRTRIVTFPDMLYEAAAWIEYTIRGAI